LADSRAVFFSFLYDNRNRASMLLLDWMLFGVFYFPSDKQND